MKKILVIGAGRSSALLIDYLLEHSTAENWKVSVADISLELAMQKTKGHPNANTLLFDARDTNSGKKLLAGNDIVVSMLPAALHLLIAKECLALGIHLATASYVSPEMQALSGDVKSRGLIFLNEMGLDPGIDHMSAMSIIDRIKASGGILKSFRSYCGGLVAPESNDNPWGYKFSWNPRNVVLAGQGTAQFRSEGLLRFLPYSHLFSNSETIRVKGLGKFDAYANRDSLSYLKHYGIEDIETILRGTLRTEGFCSAWNAFVQLGLTDDSWKLPADKFKTWDQLLTAFLPTGTGTLKKRTARFLQLKENNSVIKKLEWLGIFAKTPVQLSSGTPAQYLQALLEKKWKLQQKDKDMVVMQHEFLYSLKGKKHQFISSLVLKGKDQDHTAMALTVGLPLAIGVKMILKGEIKSRGVLILPGHYFFPGLTGDWQHVHECIRVSYAMDDGLVSAGIKIIAEEVKRAFRS